MILPSALCNSMRQSNSRLLEDTRVANFPDLREVFPVHDRPLNEVVISPLVIDDQEVWPVRIFESFSFDAPLDWEEFVQLHVSSPLERFHEARTLTTDKRVHLVTGVFVQPVTDLSGFLESFLFGQPLLCRSAIDNDFHVIDSYDLEDGVLIEKHQKSPWFVVYEDSLQQTNGNVNN
jgi:hypothetical protein